MSDLNQCNFIGRLGADPETRYMPNGDAVVNFSIACSRKWKDKSGEKQEETEWIRVTAFSKLAEIMSEYLRKGSQVFISGEFRTRKWEKDGKTNYMVEILANKMQMIGGRSDDSAGGNTAPRRNAATRPAGSAPAASKPSGAAAFGDMDDDIPF